MKSKRNDRLVELGKESIRLQAHKIYAPKRDADTGRRDSRGDSSKPKQR